MNTGGDAAEQIVRMSLEGFEVAVKITGAGAKNIAVLLYSILKEEQKTKGKARLTNLLRSGKPLKIYTLKNDDLRKFAQEAKKYGVLYYAMVDRKNKDPKAEVDILAPIEDAAKISRIVERFKLSAVESDIVVQEEKTKDGKTDIAEPDIGVQEKAEKDKLLDALMGKPTQKEENAPENPSVAKTEKSPPSEPFSEKPSKSAEGATMTDKKPSVKEELRKIKESRKEQEADAPVAQDKSRASDRAKGKVGKTEHKQPPKRKTPKKSKGAR